MLKQDDKKQVKKVQLRIDIGGRQKPVTKEALVCSKSGKIIKFLEKGD
jgi:hypothetical protein